MAREEHRMAHRIPETIQARLNEPRALSPLIRGEYERPVADLIRPAAEVGGDRLAAILGIPFDTSSMGRRGAKGGGARGASEEIARDEGVEVEWVEAVEDRAGGVRRGAHRSR